MKKAFSFVELIIVIAVLGILAAIILPEFQSHTTQAREAAAKDNLRILRAAIQFYAARHNGTAPGYPNNNPQALPFEVEFKIDMTQEKYLREIPENPFNNLQTLNMIPNDTAFPPEATGNFGWIYKAAAKTIRLDWLGTDAEGVRYYDY